jgi:nucleoside-diphosphate-sugar epimerase
MKVCVLGSNGFIGKNLMKWRWINWVGISRKELNLLDQEKVDEFFAKYKFDVVVHCGAKLHKDSMYENILMFENIVRAFKGKIIYFSSGAAVRGNPPTDQYGLSKWVIDRRIETLPNVYCLRVWGCYGPHELPTRFSAVCLREGHVKIDKDRYFDFVDVKDVRKVVDEYISGKRTEKEVDLVYSKVRLLSQWAKFFGATYEIEDASELGESYISQRTKLM